jgi:ribosome biogenesis GTPase
VVRRAAGEKTEPQVVAGNVDVGLIVTSGNADLNPRRLERYLVTMRDGGVTPVIALTKIDLLDDAAVDAAVATIEAAAPGVEVVPLCAIDGRGVEALAARLGVGRTAVLVGSSGVGKSTLTNWLLGRAAQETRAIREGDDRGRHTTTRRELFVLPDPPGGVLIDTPGMRELQLWTDEGDDEAAEHDDVAALAEQCRFADCKHREEPGCAVRAAVERGELAADRLEGYRKLQGELAVEAKRRDAAARTEDKRKAKVAQRSLRDRLRDKGRKD